MKKILILLLMIFSVITQAQTQQTTIRFGVNFFYPPFVYTDDTATNVYGFDIELAQALCNEINAICTFTPMSLTDAFTNLNNNHIDAIISAISITPTRKMQYRFAGPYFKNTMSYLGRNDTSSNTTASAMTNKTIGVIKNSTFETYLLQTHGTKINVKTYTDIEDAIDELSDKQIDLILLDTPVAQYWVANGGHQFKIVGSPPSNNNFLDQGYGIVVKLNNIKLAEQLDSALLMLIHNGTLDTIKKRYFNP